MTMINHDQQHEQQHCSTTNKKMMISKFHDNNNNNNYNNDDDSKNIKQMESTARFKKLLSNILIYYSNKNNDYDNNDNNASMIDHRRSSIDVQNIFRNPDNNNHESDLIPMDCQQHQNHHHHRIHYYNDYYNDFNHQKQKSWTKLSIFSYTFRIFDSLKNINKLSSLLLLLSLIILSFSDFLVKTIDCIQVVSLNVPAHVRKGSDLELSCLFDLDNQTLYSLKWFYRAHEWDRDEQEFFRFTPRHKPYKQVFPLDGIQVDLSKSSGSIVYIKRASSKTSGKYKCEISVEETFQTVAAEKLMTVYNSSNHTFGINSILLLLLSIIILSLLI